MHQRGLCISYKRLSSISIDLANSVTAFFKAIGAVVHTQARKGVFTMMGYDNYDADPSSTTSMKSSTHGTALSIYQLPSSEETTGELIDLESHIGMDQAVKYI